MASRETILRQKLIISKLRLYPSSWNEISVFLANQTQLLGYDLLISKRQFQRLIRDVNDLYEITIKYNKSKHWYFIDNDSLATNTDIEAYDIFTLLKIGSQHSDKIIFEKRRPTGIENIPSLLFAINNLQSVEFLYKKFYEECDEHRRLIPLILKESNNRWYIIGYDMIREAIRVFGIDRISLLTLGKKAKIPPIAIDVHKIFDSCFGIILPQNEQRVEEVVLSYTPFQGQYLKTMPLHSSQKILIDDKNEVRISINVYVTRDLIMEILSAGSNLKVISPSILKKQVESEHLKAGGQ